MPLLNRILVVVLLASALAGVGVWAQTQIPQPQTPTIVSGNDLGFRIDGRKNGKPTGALVVRINGQWIETEAAVGFQRLTAK